MKSITRVFSILEASVRLSVTFKLLIYSLAKPFELCSPFRLVVVGVIGARDMKWQVDKAKIGRRVRGEVGL